MTSKSITKHLRQELYEFRLDYVVLFLCAFLYLATTFVIRSDRSLQFFLNVAFAGFYIGWGAVHHMLDKTLTFKVVLEYLLIAGTILILTEVFLVN